ncbi:TolC family protein [Azohydromonas australica]|uniref:TolC family protein n=1 Tax=Azohydromonas australica TaxID=364039 RepID=UPI0003F54AE5|nr:TolC family protein [Azohydromonas australica]
MTTPFTNHDTVRARPRKRLAVAALALLALGGCASTAVQQNLGLAQDVASQRLGAPLKWLTTDEARQEARTDVDRLLQQPLSADDAVRIALAYSPGVQALLSDAAASSYQATQSARLPNPVFAFERLVRNEGGERELEIGRALSFPLLDLLLLPARTRIANAQQQQIRLRMAGDVVQAATQARQAWVRAVAAVQAQAYFEQVKETADAGAELARRMQSAGNFNRLQRAREQVFSAEAVAQLARARQEALASREALVRALGLNDAQAQALKLPERLPDLPAAPREERAVMQAALDERLDMRQARAELESSARSQGITTVTSVVGDFELGAVRNSESGRPHQRGYELALPLPIFNAGDATRGAAQARYMAAVHRTTQLAVDAASQVRESYGGYRTAFDLARHWRDEIVPLRKTISDENQLRYNGMLIGVFELLADARDQVAAVAQAVNTQRDFWLADAALQSALIGRPATAGVSLQAAPAATGGGSAGGH